MLGILRVLSWGSYREDKEPGLGARGDYWIQFLQIRRAERKTSALLQQWYWEGGAPGFTTAFSLLLSPPATHQHFNLKIQYSVREDRLLMLTSLDR